MKKLILFLILVIALSGCQASDLFSKFTKQDADQDESRITLENSYQEASGEYTIKYPANWIFEDARENTVVFSGEKETETYQTIIKVQKYTRPEDLDMPESMDKLLNSLQRSTLFQSEKAKFDDEKIYIYQSTGLELEGKELMVEFISKDGKHFKERMIIVPDPDGNSLYYWGYNAPLDLYDNYLNIAESMLDSWQITP